MRTTSFPGALLAAVFLLFLHRAGAQDMKLYYGLLHAHTAFSDGSGTPEEAYQMARREGLDFFAVTPHNHLTAEAGAKERADGLLIARDHRLYNGTGMLTRTQRFGDGSTKTLTARSVIGASKTTTTPAFSALYGQEFSTISSGNHANVFGMPDVLENESGNFRSLIATLKDEQERSGLAPVVQLNHPDVRDDLRGGPHSFNDYGIDSADLGPHFRDWVAEVDEYVSLIEVLTGPAMSKAARVAHKYASLENDYYFYLSQGLHVSPSAGQDNHYRNWGTATPARTGVYARSNTSADLYAAMRANRTFATDDRNMAIEFRVNGRFLGETVYVQADEELQLEVMVSDSDEPDATYRISLVSGRVDPQHVRDARPASAKDSVLQVIPPTAGADGNVFSFLPLLAAEGEVFFYVTARQNDGNRIWSAPIWVSTAAQPGTQAPTSGRFAWTRGNSRFYHRSNCPSVRIIKAENLVFGETPPAGRQQHACREDVD